jgi:prepilin-type N-terminal cleavage/methylation domain-containing protein
VRRGFTLIELVIVIGLIALVGGLIVVNAQGILRGLGSQPAERILQKAIREARFQAATLKESSFLQYDSESGRLFITSSRGEGLAEFMMPGDSTGVPPEVTFEQVLPVAGNERPGDAETSPILLVVFRPDRSSTPFQAKLTDSSGSFTLRYDPFSSIVIRDSRRD